LPQPCFRATATSKAASPRRAGELSRLAAAGCRHALAGTVTKNLDIEPIGTGKDGKPVYLKDIWPTAKEINAFIKKYVTSTIFKKKYADVFKGDTNWRKIKTVASDTYKWNMSSTYVQNPPYFEGMKMEPEPTTDIVEARPCAVRRQDHHRPHLAGRFDQADLARRQVSPSIRCARRTSTSTARAAATTK
jgi:hypothetical protein